MLFPREAIERLIESMIRPIRQRVMMIIARGILESIKDGEGIQLSKSTFLSDETRDDMERIQNYGFTSHPPDGSEVVAAFIGGNREHGFVISCDNRSFRLKNLEKGEIALYTDEGDKIHFQRGGKIVVDSNNIELGQGALESLVQGEAFLALFNSHTHLGNLLAPTGPPQIPMTPIPHLSSKVKSAL